MRGKHGKSAAVRHDVADLKARALNAERELANVTAEYAAYRERTESEIRSQRDLLRGARVADVRTLEVEMGKATERANRLRAERDEALAEKDRAIRAVNTARSQLARLHNATVDALDDPRLAWDILVNAGLARRSPSGEKIAWVADGVGHRKPSGAVHRGWRTPGEG